MFRVASGCKSPIATLLAAAGLVAAALINVSHIAPVAHAVDIVWDGGDGDWNALPPGKWNGGQISLDVFGRDDGWVVGNGEIGSDVFILSGNVTYDTNSFGDFRFISGAPENGGTLTIGGGPGSPASLSMDISYELGADQDGYWSQFNADTLNLNNGVFRRTHTPTSDGTPSSGGLMQFGGIRGFPNADIKVNLTNGGGIENDGQLTFGWYLQRDNAVGRKITFTIDDGYLDLTGSNKWDHLDGQGGGGGNADLNIHYGWNSVTNAPAGEQYAINFIGPGSITVDEGGILVVKQIGVGDGDFDFDTVTTPRTYQYLWDIGILQANGQSGLDSANFNDFFAVENSLGQADYKLISKVGAVEPVAGDYDQDLDVDGDDFLKWQRDFGMAVEPAGTGADGDGDGMVGEGDFNVWQTNWGGPEGAGAALSTVPEPTSLAAVVSCLLLTGACRRRSRRS